MRPRLSVTRNTTPIQLSASMVTGISGSWKAYRLAFSSSGRAASLSHLEMDCRVTPIFSPSCSWERPSLRRWAAMVWPMVMAAFPLCCFAALSIAQSRPICPPAVRCDLSTSGCIRISTRFPPGRPSPGVPAEANSPVGFGRENEPELRGPDGCRPSPAAGQSRKIS